MENTLINLYYTDFFIVIKKNYKKLFSAETFASP